MNQPPKGLLANVALSTPPLVPDVAPSVVPAPTPSDAPIDPNYFEPSHTDVLLDIANRLAIMPDEELRTRDEQRGKFIGVLLERIVALEIGLLPFAQIGMVLSNARLCLRAAGQDQEPAGGHWINQVTSTHHTKSEGLFFTAIDVVGRKRTEQHVMDMFARVQAEQAARAQQQAHIAAGGKLQ